MENENLLFEMSLKILQNMDNRHFKEIKSGTGLLELSCTIVEESYLRLNKLSKSVSKKQTAVMLAKPLLEKLKEKKMVSDYTEKNINEFLKIDYIEDTVDDLILLWKDKSEELETKCSCLISVLKIFLTKRKEKTSLYNVKND